MPVGEGIVAAGGLAGPFADVVRVEKRRDEEEGLIARGAQELVAGGQHVGIEPVVAQVTGEAEAVPRFVVGVVRDVPFAHVAGVVAVLREPAREGLADHATFLGVEGHAGLVRHEAGDPAGAGRHADRVGAISLFKGHALRGKLIHGGGAKPGVAGVAHGV